VDTEHGRRVGVIGLGLMGTAIADRLLAARFIPYVWNRTHDKAGSLLARGAVWSDDPIAACDRVVVSLFSSEVVDEVLSRLQGSVWPGQIVIDKPTG
jgi:3-hydroxyisobutyrate dehydrogenase-like beta-hydroxyacid dehydrogenase